MNYQRRQSKGFTLIELLVVIAIIGILSTLAIIALGSARLKARDTKRVADLNQIGKALELYYSDNNTYPTIITPGQPIASGSSVYLSQVPSNPTPRNDGNCPNANYIYYGGSQAYALTSCLGGTSGNISAGIFFATPQGSASCGVPIVDRDGYAYNTVQIGSQCWMAKNLETRTKPNGTLITSGVSGLRDCAGAVNLNGSEADCDAGNAVYTWAGAMDGSTTEGAQGMCPDGWHIPSDTEQDTLDQYLKTVGQLCNPARDGVYSCSGAGTKMASGGSSGFNALLSGQRSPGNTFSYYGQMFTYWSSTPGDSTHAFDRAFYTGINSGATVVREAAARTYGMSIRCLKN